MVKVRTEETSYKEHCYTEAPKQPCDAFARIVKDRCLPVSPLQEICNTPATHQWIGGCAYKIKIDAETPYF